LAHAHRIRCRDSRQSGLNPKYRSGQFPREWNEAFFVGFWKELLKGKFVGDVPFVADSGITLTPNP
jgi:hypothetical protein